MVNNRIGQLMKMLLITAIIASCKDRESMEPSVQLVQGVAADSARFSSVVNLVSLACTGTRIHKNWIITAKHCVPLLKEERRLTLKNESTEVNQYEVLQVEANAKSDVAIIRLNNLPKTISVSGFQSVPLVGAFLLTSLGYGCNVREGFSSDSQSTSGTTTNKLQMLQCKASFAPTGLMQPCDFMGKKDSIETTPGLCKGDSGGPMMLEKNKKQFVVGVNSNVHISGVSSFARIEEAEVAAWLRKFVKD